MPDPRCILCIPFASDDLDRKKAFQIIYNHYSLLGYNIFIGESNPFTRSASRNGSVPYIDFDVLVFVDADVLVPLKQIQDAIALAYQENEMVLAYTDLLDLTEEQTKFFYNNYRLDSTWKKPIKNQISGAFAITKDLWEQVGGYDERFKEWGGEDRAFYYACAVVKHRTENKRIDGLAYHLYHNKKETEHFDFLSFNPLLKKYKQVLELSDKFNTHLDVVQDTKPFLSILKEKNGPLNFETKGYLSCPVDLLTSLLYSKPTISSPLIGVTIPCFKSRFTLKQALLSAIEQTYQNCMIFIVSDGDLSSFDYIRDINHERVLFLRSKNNIGRYAIDHLLCTHILPMFGCKYWAPLDSDDYVSKDWLLNMKSAIKGNDVVFTDQYIEPLISNKYIEKVTPYRNDGKLMWSAHLGGLWNLKFVLENNLTNPKYRVGWDTIMTLVPWLIGNVKVIEKPLYTRVKRHQSLTNAKETNFKSNYRKSVIKDLNIIWASITKNPNRTHEILRRSRWKTNPFVTI